MGERVVATNLQLKELIDQFNIKRLQQGLPSMSPRAIALACELSPSVVSEMIRRRVTRVDIDTLDKISNFLGVTPNDILGYIPSTKEADR